MATKAEGKFLRNPNKTDGGKAAVLFFRYEEMYIKVIVFSDISIIYFITGLFGVIRNL